MLAPIHCPHGRQVLFLIVSHQNPTRDRIAILNTTHKVLHYLSLISSFGFTLSNPSFQPNWTIFTYLDELCGPISGTLHLLFLSLEYSFISYLCTGLGSTHPSSCLSPPREGHPVLFCPGAACPSQENVVSSLWSMPLCRKGWFFQSVSTIDCDPLGQWFSNTAAELRLQGDQLGLR